MVSKSRLVRVIFVLRERLLIKLIIEMKETKVLFGMVVMRRPWCCRDNFIL